MTRKKCCERQNCLDRWRCLFSQDDLYMIDMVNHAIHLIDSENSSVNHVHPVSFLSCGSCFSWLKDLWAFLVGERLQAICVNPLHPRSNHSSHVTLCQIRFLCNPLMMFIVGQRSIASHDLSSTAQSIHRSGDDSAGVACSFTDWVDASHFWNLAAFVIS